MHGHLAIIKLHIYLANIIVLGWYFTTWILHIVVMFVVSYLYFILFFISVATHGHGPSIYIYKNMQVNGSLLYIGFCPRAQKSETTLIKHDHTKPLHQNSELPRA
jgi:sensor histidine kinase YesM